MDQLLQLYTELLRSAEDHQIPQHLTNLINDAAAMTDAIKAVVDQARERAANPQ